MTNTTHERQKITIPDLARMKALEERITMITAYDATFARLVDSAGVDMILVGDSVGMVVQGVANTIPVELDEMAYHVRLVSRAKPAAIIVGDLPFGSYQVSPQQAVESSIRLMKAGAECVKLEGGLVMAETIQAITRVDMPVVGHIGLTPQSYHRMGGHKVQGKKSGFEAGGRERLLEDAHAVEQAGACAIVVEGVPRDLAKEITAAIPIPTIGIGASAGCDGQILVIDDMLGMFGRVPKFVKKFGRVGDEITAAVSAYAAEVKARTFPAAEHTYGVLESDKAKTKP